MRTILTCLLASALVANLGWAEGSLTPKEIRAPDGAHTLEIGIGVRVAHKALQSDTDLPVDELARQAGASGRLVAQQCRLGDWLDSRRITVNGELVFSGQKKVRYGYTLVFTGEPGHLDPGGFEEGVIKGVGYHLR